MRAINITISAQEEQQLQNLVLFSPNVMLRTRCRIILLRAKGMTTKDIADFVGLKPQSVNRWLKAYIQDGLNGLIGNLKCDWDAIVKTESTVEMQLTDQMASVNEPRCLPHSPSADNLLSPEAAIRLICDNINSWNAQIGILAKMDILDLLELIRNDCKQTAFLLGATPLTDETSYNVRRHELVEGNGRFPMPGDEIDSTIECGVELDGEALVRAKVTLK